MITIAIITLLIFLVLGVPVSFAIGLSGLLAIDPLTCPLILRELRKLRHLSVPSRMKLIPIMWKWEP